MEGNDGTIRNSRPDIRFMTAERGYDNIISSLPSVDVPWTENFNGTPRGIDSLWYTQNAFHYIWRFDANNTYTNNDPDNFAIGVTTNDGSAYAHIFAENDENLEGILISPIINMNGQSGTLTFKYCNKSWFYDFDTIIVMGLDPSSQDIMPLLTIDEPSDTWQEVSVELPTCQQIIIGFAAHNGYGYGIGIDDISVAARPNAYLLGFDYGIVGDTMSFITLFNEDVDNTWDISGTDNEWYEQVDNMFEMAYAVWDTPGNYTISLTATRGNLSTTVTKNITIMNHRLACFDFSTEEQFQEWTVIDNDGDQSNWEYDNEWQAVRSRSWDQHPLAPDNWLISPAIHLPNNTAAIAWQDYASDRTDYAEHYSVLVSTSGTDISDFTDVVFETTIDKGQTWQTRVVNLSNYSNQDIYIAFRHHDCTDQKELYLNSICVMVNSLDEVGIADVESSDINIFPNPANDRVKVSANETIRNIKLYSMTGAMISNFETEATEYEISTCNIPAGAYIIRITTDNGVSNRRLIIK